MRSVVDASIATKWFLDETGSEATRAVIGGDDLIAPDLILSETYHTV